MACTDTSVCYPSLKSDSNLNTLMYSEDVYDFKYQLYGDTNQYDLWYDWVTDSSNTPYYQEEQNADIYEGYVMKIRCDFSGTTTKQYSACCLRSSASGGFCLENTGTTPSTTFATFALTND